MAAKTTMTLSATEMAILAEAVDWLLRTDRTVVGRDRIRVQKLLEKLGRDGRSLLDEPA